MIVLDASALLALLFREPGHDVVSECLSGACISSVNLSEVLGRFSRDGHSASLISERIREVISVVTFDESQALLCAELLPATAALGLSLGDRACLALAATLKCPAITADRAWRTLDIGVSIELIR